jgi:hypothetical protein
VTRSTQDKFAAALAAIAEDAGLELVIDTKWANAGTYRIEAPDSFTPTIAMSYSFQDGYASFDDLVPTDLGDRDKMLRDYAGGPIYPHGTHFPYVTPEELDSRVLSAVRNRLSAVRA